MKQVKVKNQKLQKWLDKITWRVEVLLIAGLWAIVIWLYYLIGRNS